VDNVAAGIEFTAFILN